MTDDFTIPFLSADLEDAGWLGLTAAGLLAPFMLGAPGAVSSTSTGFVWTKTLLSGLAGESVPFGIGRLKINSGSITATLGVNWYNGVPEVDLLFSLLGSAAIELEVDQAYAWLADKQTLPGDSSQIIGYDKSNPQPLTIPLPSTALEFSFRAGEDGRVSSALRTHGAVAGVAEIASGVFRWSPNPEKVIVVPKLFDAALAVQDLFIDCSDGAAVGTFLEQFPEVYDPNWKGFGATNLSLVIPVDADEFVTVGAQGFIYGFDGRFSGKCFYNWAGEIGKLRGIELGIYVRNDDIVAGDVGMIFDLADSAQTLADQVQSAGPTGATTSQQDLLNGNRNNLATATTNEPDLQALLADGLVRLNGRLVSTRIDPPPVLNPNCPQAAQPHPTFVFGLDLQMDSLTVVKPDQPELGPQPATALTGTQARYVSWLLGGAIFGPALLTAGIVNDDSGDLATGIGLMLLTGVDLVDYLTSLDPLPDLERLSLGKLGLRYIHVSRFDTEACRHDSEHFLEVYGDLGLRYQLDSGLVDLIGGIASLAGSTGAMTANIFGWDLTHIRLKGALELELANISLGLKFDGDGVHLMPEMDVQIRRLFNQQRMQITAKDLPDIQLTETTGVEGSGKPIVSVDFVQNQVDGVYKYGIAVSLKGIGGASLSVNGAAAGLIFYFSPELDVVFAPQVSQEPGFHFLVPPVCYAEGVIDLEKPLPGFGGTQNRIAVDVGLYNEAVKPGKQIDKAQMAALKELKNYTYQFGGEVVWGDATGGPSNEPYDFWFVEVHYEGKTPFVTIGPLGIFGLGGLLGRNIAPGITGGRANAVGIANWIRGSGNGAFDNVKNWPAGVPSDSTWHPARDWTKNRDLWAAGLFVKAGSADDGGKKVMVDSILMLGLPEVWVALAGYAIIKPINGRLAVVIVYDQASGSFVIKAVLSFKVDEESGEIVKVKTKFELGTMEQPEHRSWLFLGHYLDAEGGAAEAELFNLFNTKFYYVVDSKQLDSFGLVPNPVVKRPNIPGPALGTGTLFQLGPKKYGPSWLNIQVYGGFGYNLALSFNPFLVYGDIYALGYIRLKVAFFKTKLELAARLYGLATFDAYRFAGQISVRLNLPWPLDDVEESVDFFLEAGSPALTEPDVETSAVGLYRLESRSQEVGSSATVELPSTR